MDAPQLSRGQERGVLARLALDRPELRAWALYDWANSAMYTVIVSSVFPIFFAEVVAAGLDPDRVRRVFGTATTISLLAAAFASPVLGALADFRRLKKTLLAAFLALGVLATGAMALLGPGDVELGLVLFGLANIGAVGSFVFYDALLPHVAREDEVDRLSTSAYALGYVGGALCLGVCLALILRPQWFLLPHGEGLDPAAASLPARISFAIVAAWWAAFSIPLFRRVAEPPLAIEADERTGDAPLSVAFTRLGETFRDLVGYRQAFVMMLAFLIYNDGIGTIIRMATLYGQERSIDRGTMLACVFAVQIVGIPFTVVFGRLAGRFGPKRAILVGLLVYAVICLVAWKLDTTAEFVLIAVLIGLVQGGSQALSRSLFASLVPKHKSGEFFGLFASLEKFAGVLGPLVFAASATSGQAILATLGFFLVGGFLLLLVDVEAGRRRARAVEQELAVADPPASGP